MKTIVKSVLVHSCELQPSVQPESSLVIGQKYVLVSQDPEDFDPVPLGDDRSYYILKAKCSCRQLVTFNHSEDLLAIGGAKAIWQLNPKKNRLELYQVEKPLFDEKVVNGKRVHTKIGTMLETHIWRRQQVKVPRIDLISAADIERAYLEDPKSSTARRYQRYIEEVHELFMKNRAELFVPFIEEDEQIKRNPVQGRLMFPFPPDDRTPGSH